MAYGVVCAVALGSRILCVALAVTWSALFPDVQFNSASSLLDAQFSKGSLPWTLAKPFLRWDAEYFFSIAAGQFYRADFHHAFFPGYPLLVRVLGWLFPVFSTAYGIVAAGVLVSNVAFIAATCGVFQFTKDLLEICATHYGAVEHPAVRRNAVALLASVAFALNPANIFASALYSESLYAAVFVWAMVALFQFEKAEAAGAIWRAQAALIAATLLLTYGTFIRSNGILALIPLFFAVLRTCPILGHRTVPTDQVKGRRTAAGNTTHFVLHWIQAASLAVCVAVPLLSVLGLGYRRYCRSDASSLSQEGNPVHGVWRQFVPNAWLFVRRVGWGAEDKPVQGTPQPDWCHNRVPSIYGYIQKAYWGVAPFAYWKWSKLDRFLSSIAFYGMACYLIVRGMVAILMLCRTKEGHRRNGWRTALHSPVLGHLLHLTVVTACMACIANVEVLVRMLIGCPLYFAGIGMVLQRLYWSTDEQVAWRRTLCRVYAFFHMFSYFVGPLFFANSMTWT